MQTIELACIGEGEATSTNTLEQGAALSLQVPVRVGPTNENTTGTGTLKTARRSKHYRKKNEATRKTAKPTKVLIPGPTTFITKNDGKAETTPIIYQKNEYCHGDISQVSD